MVKNVTLKDGSTAVIRPPTEADVDKSFEFFQNLSDDDREYLRTDTTDKTNVAKRLKGSGLVNVKRLVAEIDGEFAADAALEIHPGGWKKHLAEFRLIVSGKYKRKGLGMILAGELYELAIKEGVEEMVIELMAPQADARKIFEKLGFSEGAVLKNYVIDVHGNKQDLVIMRCSLEKIWDQIESYFRDAEVHFRQEYR